MEVTISAKTLIELAALLTALGVIGGVALWAVRFVARQKKQDQELSAIRKEQQIICYGVMACLKGLKEQGCDGPVTEALGKLEKHLNQAAHEENPALYTQYGIPLYRWDGEQVVRRSETDIQADRASLPAPAPSEQERLRADVDFLAALQGVTP